jgi:hypothetical protein
MSEKELQPPYCIHKVHVSCIGVLIYQYITYETLVYSFTTENSLKYLAI